jgi:hypothetical protein
MREDLAVSSHRQALRAWLLFIPGIGFITNQFLHATPGSLEDKVMAGGTPANPAAMALNLSYVGTL